jgi:hypothetical protein
MHCSVDSESLDTVERVEVLQVRVGVVGGSIWDLVVGKI